jgi:hypothetical protein
VLASVAWGAVGAWAANEHASGANEVVSTSEPLSLAAQRMYRSLADADVTATTAFLTVQSAVDPAAVSSTTAQLTMRQRFEADLASAGADLAVLRGAGGGGSNTAANRQLTAELTTISTGLQAYRSYVNQAQNFLSNNLQLAGGALLQVASEEMHTALLPAAGAIYTQESSDLQSASAQATGWPWIIVTVLLAIGIGYVLLRSQRWLSRRTHRRINFGLLLASAALLVSALWLVVAFVSARSDFDQGIGHGSAPAESLARAVIASEGARGDQILNLISRTGSSSFDPDFTAQTHLVGPGQGSLLSAAEAASPASSQGDVLAAERSAAAWEKVANQAFKLDAAGQFLQETNLVIGSGTGFSSFTGLESSLGRAITTDQNVFSTNAARGSSAYGGLEAAMIIAALLMAAGCAWGLSRRLAEYR